MSVCAAGPVTLHSPPICPCQTSLLSSPLLSPSFYSFTFFLSFTLTFGKTLLSHNQHEQRAVGVSCNQDGLWLIGPLDHVRKRCLQEWYTKTQRGAWLLRHFKASPGLWCSPADGRQKWRWTAGSAWQKQSTESDRCVWKTATVSLTQPFSHYHVKWWQQLQQLRLISLNLRANLGVR